MEALFGEQTYFITVSQLTKEKRYIVITRLLPALVIILSREVDPEPSTWHSQLRQYISQFSNGLANMWVTLFSQLTSFGVEEFF